MTSGPKGGPLEKIFFKHVFMIWKWLFWWKETFFHILKQFEAYWKIFKTGRKKFKGWPQDQRGDHWKKNFSNMFYDLKMIVLMKGNVFSYFKTIWSYWKIFKTGRKKNLRGDLRTKGGTIGKNFFQTCFYDLKMIVLMKGNVFSYFKTIWSVLKNFQNWPKKI